MQPPRRSRSVTEQLDAVRQGTPQPGDNYVTDDHQRRYTVKNLKTFDLGKGNKLVTCTMVRAIPKVRGKAARKAEKRARRRERANAEG